MASRELLELLAVCRLTMSLEPPSLARHFRREDITWLGEGPTLLRHEDPRPPRSSFLSPCHPQISTVIIHVMWLSCRNCS